MVPDLGSSRLRRSSGDLPLGFKIADDMWHEHQYLRERWNGDHEMATRRKQSTCVEIIQPVAFEAVHAAANETIM